MNTEQKSEFYCDGGLKNKGEYILGTDIKTGKWRTYFSNGKLESEGEYKNGKKIGTWIYYHETGQFREEKIFKNGRILKEANIKLGVDENENDNL